MFVLDCVLSNIFLDNIIYIQSNRHDKWHVNIVFLINGLMDVMFVADGRKWDTAWWLQLKLQWSIIFSYFTFVMDYLDYHQHHSFDLMMCFNLYVNVIEFGLRQYNVLIHN